MGECCSLPKPSQVESASLCVECGAKGRSVERRTVLHHVKSELLLQVSNDDYRFCAAPACAVVYYGTRGAVFTVNDVRELITAKANGDARPLCYCFGFTEGDIRNEIMQTKETSIPAQIGQLIKEKICACELRNPSGACCLGEVNQTMKQLSAKGETENA